MRAIPAGHPAGELEDAGPAMGRHTLLTRCIDAEVALASKVMASASWDSATTAPPPLPIRGGELVEPLLGVLIDTINAIRAEGSHPSPVSVELRMEASGIDSALGSQRGLTRLMTAGMGLIGPEGAYLAAWRRARDQLALWDAAYTLMGDLEQQGAPSAGELLEQLAPEFARIKASATMAPNTLRDLARSIAMRVGAPVDQTVYSSGLPALDAALGGGFNGGLLYGLQARKKVGKTLWLGTLALNMALQGHRVCYYCFEMGEERIAERMIASHYGGHLNSMALLKARNSASLAREIGSYANEHAPDNLLFIDRARPELPWLESIAEENHRARGSRVHVFDYCQLVRGSDRRMSRVDQVDEVCDWMADFAKRTGDVCLTAAQLNRMGETRYGDGLVMAASQVFNIHRRDVDLAGFEQTEYWLECCDSRYTDGADAGSKDDWPFVLNKIGPRISQKGRADPTIVPQYHSGDLLDASR